jgi:hypothetical protein
MLEKINKNLHFPIRNPLHEKDSSTSTYGCRHSNPDICGFCYMDKVCAFVTDDDICRHPSRFWARYYKELSNN